MQCPLQVALIRDNYIKGIKYSYEQYLVEFLNASRLRTDKGGTFFKHIIIQDHKEPDAANEEYEIDFKLFVDQNYVYAKRNYSTGILSMNGMNIYTAPEKINGHTLCYDMVKLIRGKNINFFENIKYEKNEMYSPLKRFMKNIEIEKNILLYLPFQYYFSDYETDEKYGKLLSEFIAKDFSGVINYRRKMTQCETYIGFISRDKFIMLKEEKELNFYDMIDTHCSPLYCEIFDISNPF